jgi:hypothetical protein
MTSAEVESFIEEMAATPPPDGRPMLSWLDPHALAPVPVRQPAIAAERPRSR